MASSRSEAATRRRAANRARAKQRDHERVRARPIIPGARVKITRRCHVEITRVRPNIFPELSDDELSDNLMQLCHKIELDKQAQMRAEGRRFMGLKKLSKTKWWTKPSTWEDRYTLEPNVASSDKWKRIAALQQNQHWAPAYAKARTKHRAGRKSEFPYGTYLLRVRYAVPAAGKPP